jgi:hypothetical protein
VDGGGRISCHDDRRRCVHHPFHARRNFDLFDLDGARLEPEQRFLAFMPLEIKPDEAVPRGFPFEHESRPILVVAAQLTDRLPALVDDLELVELPVVKFRVEPQSKVEKPKRVGRRIRRFGSGPGAVELRDQGQMPGGRVVGVEIAGPGSEADQQQAGPHRKR